MAEAVRQHAARPWRSAHDYVAGSRGRRLGLLTLRVAAATYAVGGVATFLITPLLGRFHGEFEDFNAYLGAANAVGRHADVYGPFTHQVSNVALSGFDYPPIVAWLVQPLAGMPPTAAATLWLWLGVACTAVAALIAAYELLPRTWPRVELAVLATFALSTSTYNYWHGQMNPEVFLLLALALRGWMRGNQVRCGLFIGIAASIKLAPVVLVVVLLRRRWWRGSFAAVATILGSVLAASVLLGTAPLREWITRVLPVLMRQDGWLYNESLNGAVNRLFGHGVLSVAPSSVAISVLTILITVAVVAMLVVAVSPRERPPAQRGAEFGAGVLVSLLVGTITWYPHYVSATIALFAVLGLIASERGRRSAALLVATGGFGASIAVMAPLLIALAASWQGVIALSHSPWWWPSLQLASLPALTATALLVALVSNLRRASLRLRIRPGGKEERSSRQQHRGSDRGGHDLPVGVVHL